MFASISYFRSSNFDVSCVRSEFDGEDVIERLRNNNTTSDLAMVYPSSFSSSYLTNVEQTRPWKVASLPEPLQAAFVLAIAVSMSAATITLHQLIADATAQHEWLQSFRYVWPLVLGPSYALTGVTYFARSDLLRRTVPRRGAWGLWWPPARWCDPSALLVGSTGAIFVVAGIGMFVGGLYDAFAPVYVTGPDVLTRAGIMPDSAAALLLATAAVVVPSELYAFTHGEEDDDVELLTTMLRSADDDDGESTTTIRLPSWWYLARAGLQIVWASALCAIAEGTFDELFAATANVST